MALLYESMHRAMDDNGVPMPFAELYTRDPVTTTTPKVTYSDPDLDVSHQNTNPLVADAAGYFGPIYAGSDEQFYLILTVADGDPNAPYKTYPDVTALGGDGGTSFDRTFASARLKITSGEVDTGISGILIQTGPSSPDETGGAVLMQGQAGTQGDLAVFDYVETRVTGTVEVTGNATLGGSALVDDDLTVTNPTKAGSIIAKLASGTATAAASVEITLDADFDAYLIEIYDLAQSAASILTAVLSFDGSTYKTAAGDYVGATKYIAGTTVGDLGSNTYMGLSPATSLASGYGAATLRLRSKAGIESFLKGQVERWDTIGNAAQAWPFALTNAKAYGKAQKIKIAPASGTITCAWALFGIPGL